MTVSPLAKADLEILDISSVDGIKHHLRSQLVHKVGVNPSDASQRDWLYALAGLVRGVLSEQLLEGEQRQRAQDARQIYYLSLEFLTGRSLMKNLYDLGMVDVVRQALEELGQNLDAVAEGEFDAALGNGGLGRLAACFLDSLATHRYPGFGYGIRYEFGMFKQRIENGEQVEYPESWLRYGSPWEFERPAITYSVRYRGHLTRFRDETGHEVVRWTDTDDVLAIAYDVPVSGYQSGIVTKLRLWAAKATHDFDLKYFNQGNYIDAVKEKSLSESLSKVLYPADTTLMGQELRLTQEYFFVSASLQDILTRFHRDHDDIHLLPEKVGIQLNDTHPSLAIPELLRLLVDHYELEWKAAWDLTRRVFHYTNHTLLPEALETWPVAMMEAILPRHLALIYQINYNFLQEVKQTFPGQQDILGRVSLVDDARQRIRMAHLCVVGSARVNGVAALHTDLMRAHVFGDFNKMTPEKFVNVTNGVTQRRWLLQSNPPLADLLKQRVGSAWITDLNQINGIENLTDDTGFCDEFHAIKRANKARLAELVLSKTEVRFNPEAIFDSQVKRIHEYKRQLLNLLHVITLYNRVRDGATDIHPRAVLIAGKSAPGYYLAKLIIHLINDVAGVINKDPKSRGVLSLAFLPNYNVSAAEVIIPGTDLSEQISTAGTEASGTGNMKFALNGALTIGTLDGANIEIKDAVGDDNIFIFGKTAAEINGLKENGYNPWDVYNATPELKRALDMISGGFFCMDDPGRYRPITEALLGRDQFFLLADYADYVAAQGRVDHAYRHTASWTRAAILNVARMGYFSSDRSIHDYANKIWNIKPLL